MVQSASAAWNSISEQVPSNWDVPSKKDGFEETKKKEWGRKETEKKGKAGDERRKENSYGAWGAIFKNKDHFSSLHHC
ncbi:uncharacterized protein LOC111692269 [Anoplophora glabripennis]|uniref:uncharacterized protein LOC111692269 n=1 Tax=Anoplophora glabripennis TaxID=217634 RepID=UPI000C784440|nr:uncharacterized protein LOC111692269 [Anoplophora glabripennis]